MRTIHPAPEVACRDAEPEEIPRTAAVLLAKATEAGWTGRTTYARGNTLAAHGEPGRVVESVAVRLRRPPLRVVALWNDGKFACGLVRLSGTKGTVRIGSRALHDLIETEEEGTSA